VDNHHKTYRDTVFLSGRALDTARFVIEPTYVPRKSRQKSYRPNSTTRTPYATPAGEPDHPFKDIIRQLCAEIEWLKTQNRVLRERLPGVETSPLLQQTPRHPD
jgi:hypothetical protein